MALLTAGCALGTRQKSHPPDWASENGAAIGPGALAVSPPPGASEQASNAVSTHTNGLLLPYGPRPSSRLLETWVPLDRWCNGRGLPTPARLSVVPLPTYALHAANGELVLRAGSQSADWSGLELRLGFAPQSINGQPFVHALDLRKTIEPLLAPGPLLLPKNNSIIVIDPGHGGENAGTKSVLGNHFEKEFTLDWARRLQTVLLTNGWQVFLTRSNDTDLSLSNRVALADAHQAELFLSLHFNSAGSDSTQAGLETYCLTPTGMASSVTRGFSDDAAEVFPNNAFDASNLQLAVRIHRALLQLSGLHDRGVRRARFPGVLRGQQRPAVLVEGGYLSNPREAKLIADPAYRERLAEAVAGALE